MPSPEGGKIEKGSFPEDKDRLRKAVLERNFLIDRVSAFKVPLEKYKRIIGTKQAERLFLKIDRLIEELKKIKPAKIVLANHFAHIIGQFQARAGWVERMEKAQNEGKEEKIKKCREILDEVIPAFSDFLDMAINNEDYLQGELRAIMVILVKMKFKMVRKYIA